MDYFGVTIFEISQDLIHFSQMFVSFPLISGIVVALPYLDHVVLLVKLDQLSL